MTASHMNHEPTRAPVARRTFLCADVDSFSPMTERLGDQASLELMNGVEALVRTACEEYGGEFVEMRGDGFLLAFASARHAAAAGLAIGAGLQRLQEDGREQGVTMRMALHTGDVLRDRGRYFGRTLIAAFRLVDRAGPCDFLLSADSAWELLDIRKSSKTAGWEDFEPKGLCGKLRFLRVAPTEIAGALH